MQYTNVSKHFRKIYCLIPRKTQETRKRVFTILKDKTAELGLYLEPAVEMSDFELCII